MVKTAIGGMEPEDSPRKKANKAVADGTMHPAQRDAMFNEGFYQKPLNSFQRHEMHADAVRFLGRNTYDRRMGM
jgi:hypothetical protein